MANWQVISLDTATPQLRAPGTGDGYSFNSGSTQLGVWTTTGLGIGTASPAQKLHVASAGNNYIVSQNTAGSTSALLLGAESGVNAIYSWTTVAGSTGRPLAFYTGASQSMHLDTSGNLGLGVTPGAWASGNTALQVGSGSGVARFAGSGVAAGFSNNVFVNSSGNSVYINSSAAHNYVQSASLGHAWFTAASGTAGNTISFTQAMTLDASGNLGVGSTSPVSLLDVATSGAVTATIRSTSTSGARDAKLRLNVPSTGGDDPAGTVEFTYGTGYTVAGSIQMTHTNNAMKFFTGTTERARITSGGDFEIGTQAGTGTRTLTVQTNTSGDPTLVLTAAGADGGSFWFERSTVRLYARASNTGGVYLASGGTSWTAVSDERKKDIIEPISNAAEKVASLRAVVGKYKTDKDGVRRSFLIAQDVQAVFPEAIDANDENELGLSYTDTIPLLVAAIKELKAELDSAKAKIAALEAK